MAEVFNFGECRIAFAQASAAGQSPYTGWNTASGAQANTAIYGYVKSLDITSAESLITIPGGMGTNRNDHFKPAGKQSIKVNMELFATGELPRYSAYNASVPMMMVEIMRKQTAGNNSAYTLLMGVAYNSIQETFAWEGNTYRGSLEALAMLNSGAGYIMT